LRGGHGEGGFWVGGFGGGGGGGGFAQGEAWDTASRGRSWKAADCRVSVMMGFWRWVSLLGHRESTVDGQDAWFGKAARECCWRC
jgi:hypothetical protein